MAFDPFTNLLSWQSILEESGLDSVMHDLSDKEYLRNFYKEPVMCLLRIRDSVDLMLKKNGSDGYFDFIEAYMECHIKGEDMNFAVNFRATSASSPFSQERPALPFLQETDLSSNLNRISQNA